MEPITKEVVEEIVMQVLHQLGLIPIEAPIESVAEAPVIKSFDETTIEAPIKTFAEAPIESFVEDPIEAPIESVAEAPVVESFDETFEETPVEAPIKAFTKPPVAQNLATTSCSGMTTKSLLQAKYIVKTAPFLRLRLHTHAAVFVFDPGGLNTSI